MAEELTNEMMFSDMLKHDYEHSMESLAGDGAHDAAVSNFINLYKTQVDDVERYNKLANENEKLELEKAKFEFEKQQACITQKSENRKFWGRLVFDGILVLLGTILSYITHESDKQFEREDSWTSDTTKSEKKSFNDLLNKLRFRK